MTRRQDLEDARGTCQGVWYVHTPRREMTRNRYQGRETQREREREREMKRLPIDIRARWRQEALPLPNLGRIVGDQVEQASLLVRVWGVLDVLIPPRLS